MIFKLEHLLHGFLERNLNSIFFANTAHHATDAAAIYENAVNPTLANASTDEMLKPLFVIALKSHIHDELFHASVDRCRPLTRAPKSSKSAQLATDANETLSLQQRLLLIFVVCGLRAMEEDPGCYWDHDLLLRHIIGKKVQRIKRFASSGRAWGLRRSRRTPTLAIVRFGCPNDLLDIANDRLLCGHLT